MTGVLHKKKQADLEKNYYQLTLERLGPDYFKNKQAEARLERDNARYGDGVKIKENEVVIVHDPDELGGYSKGSRIGNLAETLYWNGFTPNTIVAYKNRKFKVVGLVHQKLVPIIE